MSDAPAPVLPAAPATPAAPSTPAASARSSDVSTLLDEKPPRSWWLRWPFLVSMVLLMLAVSCYFWWRQQQRADAAPRYTTALVERGNLTLSVTANGTLQPTRSVNIGSELSGTVLKVNVDVNDRIQKGQVLVVLDTAKLRDQILRSQAALAAARAKVQLAGATVKEAQASLARLEAVALLSGGKVPSKAELDTGRAARDRALADETSARAGVNDAQAALSTDQITLSKASITAPTAGVVLTRAVDPGNAVAASLQAVTLFTVAEDLARLRLWVYVDEADVAEVKVGQDASFTVSAYLTRNFPAKVTRVGLGSTITDNVVTYLTYLDVDNTDLSLRPGMTATATIVAKQRNNVLMVPNTALRFAPSAAPAGGAASGGGGLSLMPRIPGTTRRSAAAGASTANAKQVWVLQGAVPEAGADSASSASGGARGAVTTSVGVPVAVAVTPGISDGRMTEITGGDLRAGMRVITDQKSGAGK